MTRGVQRGTGREPPPCTNAPTQPATREGELARAVRTHAAATRHAREIVVACAAWSRSPSRQRAHHPACVRAAARRASLARECAAVQSVVFFTGTRRPWGFGYVRERGCEL